MAAGDVENLATLATLDEQSLLNEISARYNASIIYTYIGDILIAVNPYRKMMIYEPDFMSCYRELRMQNAQPPHLFAISDAAFQGMRRNMINQCCVISGESGAGKTETTKFMIQHIVFLCYHSSSDLQQRIIQVNPLLEAFGNAQTVMNNNSSRFGKYIEMQFDSSAQLLGAKISEYLLEQSRVISQAPGEKNFHIFYYMFAGLEAEQLRNNLLHRPENHRILWPADGRPAFATESDFAYNQEMWARLRSIMHVVGFRPVDVSSITAILAAILHITDIQFEHDPETDGVFIVEEALLEMAAELLAISPEDLAVALISNITQLRGEKIMSLKNETQASEGRDALGKALYGRLFGWIVRQINFMLEPTDRRQSVNSTIGVLDLAGFENFQRNSFEQMCINAANEQLHYYFNQHIFQWEQDEYRREGIRVRDIKYSDNKPLIDLFLESPLGLLSLLDEESRFPKSTDATLLEKLAKNLAKRPNFQRPKGKALEFTIQHFAGPVTYQVEGFLEKNRDTLSWNLLNLMMNSESQFVSDLFYSPVSETGSLRRNPNAPKRSRQSILLCKAPDLTKIHSRSLSKKAGKRLKSRCRQGGEMQAYENLPRTLAAKFKNSLTELIGKLLDAEPHFVRCIKPNDSKRPAFIQSALVMQQLRYTGVLETVRIRRHGYSTRLPFHIFLDRFRFVAFKLTADTAPTGANCAVVLRKAGLKDWEIGKTKVFLKYWHTEHLTMTLAHLDRSVVTCQRLARGYIARRGVRWLHKVALQNNVDLRAFCAHVTRASDERLYTLARQQDHDQQRKQEMDRERTARIRRPLAPDDITSVRPIAPKKIIYQPTPIILGNPVKGNPNPITGAAPGRGNITPTLLEPVSPHGTGNRRAGLWRGGSAKPPTAGFEYPTETMISSVPRNYDYDDTTHYARKNSLASQKPLKPDQEFIYHHLVNTMEKMHEVDPTIWLKIFYFEKAELVAKFYVQEWELIIDDSMKEYDTKVIGLKAFGNRYRDDTTQQVLKKIGKGVKLSRDADGNIFAAKLAKCDVIAKGYHDVDSQCLSEAVISRSGRLEKTPSKIFDMAKFKGHILSQLRDGSEFDARRLQLLSAVCFSFARNTFTVKETPCWVCLVNFLALNIIGNPAALPDLMALANLNITGPDLTQLERNWQEMQLSNGEMIESGADAATTLTSAPRGRHASQLDTGNAQDRRSRSPDYADTITPADSPGSQRANRVIGGERKWAKLRSNRL